ncbi:expressed unknown protein [Seminavis robusta]|uniref:Uncharacterized protein n=1 Tax=Seminavis robusta TaxID=568900 RepID=A0A9N8HAX9_9STRA|nr:expressed unknown protein [Seminavis robusta]|eukprot:Sro241_g096480.1 n/a (278) ;mRNA; f:72793-74244
MMMRLGLLTTTTTVLLLATVHQVSPQAVDPGICAADGEDRFSCQVESSMTLQLGPDQTVTNSIAASINCLLDDQVGLNFQESEGCTCAATVTDGATGATRTCGCGVCPQGAQGAVSINCTGVENAGPCPFLGCDGSCAGGPGGSSNLGATPEPAATPAPTSSSRKFVAWNFSTKTVYFIHLVFCGGLADGQNDFNELNRIESNRMTTPVILTSRTAHTALAVAAKEKKTQVTLNFCFAAKQEVKRAEFIPSECHGQSLFAPTFLRGGSYSNSKTAAQ